MGVTKKTNKNNKKKDKEDENTINKTESEDSDNGNAATNAHTNNIFRKPADISTFQNNKVSQNPFTMFNSGFKLNFGGYNAQTNKDENTTVSNTQKTATQSKKKKVTREDENTDSDSDS